MVGQISNMRYKKISELIFILDILFIENVQICANKHSKITLETKNVSNTFKINANMMDDYRNLSPERIPSIPGKKAAIERFIAESEDRLNNQIFHVNFTCYKSCFIFRYVYSLNSYV